MKKRVANIIIEHLLQEDIKYIFGVTGKAISPLIDATLDYEEIKYISARHEGGAALMAFGYAQGSGEIGVCCGTTGGGSTNLATGVATAYMNSVPMLVFTGQIATIEFGKGGFQESTGYGQSIDTVDFFKSITKESLTLINPLKVAETIRYAIRSATSGRKGPVHINIPVDIQFAEVEYELQEKIKTNISYELSWESVAMDDTIALIDDAKRPVFLVGWGGCLSGANLEIIEIAEKLNIPIATTLQGKGGVHAKHPLYIGIMGLAGHNSAIDYIFEKADLMIAVGTTFNEFTSLNWDIGILKNKKIIQIDIDGREIGKNYPVQVGLVGDAKIIIHQLKILVEKLEIKPKSFNNSNKNIKVLIENPDNNVEVVIEDNRIYINTDNFENNSILISTRKEKYVPDASPFDGMGVIINNSEENNIVKFTNPEKMLDESIPIKPQRLMKDIRDNCPNDSIFLADSGSHWAWAMHYLPVYPGGDFYPTLSLGAMGASICSAMGVKLAKPDQVVICICGDGSFLMQGNEISTADQYNIPVIWVILNDSSYNMPAISSQMIYHRTVGVHFNKTNFAKLAEAYNIKGYNVEKPGELTDILSEIISSKRPAIIDVNIARDEIPPIGNRLKYKK
jgi:acetolactate synthase I/II/III large subunit